MQLKKIHLYSYMDRVYLTALINFYLFRLTYSAHLKDVMTKKDLHAIKKTDHD